MSEDTQTTPSEPAPETPPSNPEMHIEVPTISLPTVPAATDTSIVLPETTLPPDEIPIPDAMPAAAPPETLPTETAAHTPPPIAPHYNEADRVKARAKKQQIKAEKKRQIMVYVEEHGRIANDIVEQLIDVSDTTAAKYIKELVHEGLLEKRGKGWQTEYTKVGVPTNNEQ
jgi:hypothetical protein